MYKIVKAGHGRLKSQLTHHALGKCAIFIGRPRAMERVTIRKTSVSRATRYTVYWISFKASGWKWTEVAVLIQKQRDHEMGAIQA